MQIKFGVNHSYTKLATQVKFSGIHQPEDLKQGSEMVLKAAAAALMELKNLQELLDEMHSGKSLGHGQGILLLGNPDLREEVRDIATGLRNTGMDAAIKVAELIEAKIEQCETEGTGRGLKL